MNGKRHFKCQIANIKWAICILPMAVMFALPLYAAPWSGILDPSRAIDWTQSGIPGGIPNRTTICSTIAGGASEASIQSALNSCAANGVVKLSAGTYSLTGPLTIPSNVTLRGAGPQQTILNASGSGAGLLNFGSDVTPVIANSISITAGSTQGSSSLSLSSAGGLSVGSYLMITQLNDPSYVTITTSNGACTWCDGGIGWNGTRVQGQIVEITSISGTTVGFTPPLYISYTLTPLATPFSMGAKYAGVEDLQVYMNNTGYTANFRMGGTAYCWIKNVESNYTDGDHVDMYWGYRNEIRDSYFHDAFTHSAGSTDTDLFLANKTSGALVENNILRRQHISVMLNWGAAGNVIAYNYTDNNFDSTGYNTLFEGFDVHGAHPMFNLWEGNLSQKLNADYYWGSSSHNTAFRNWFKGAEQIIPPLTGRAAEQPTNAYWASQALSGIDLTNTVRYYNLVGNVIGSDWQKALGTYTPQVVWPTARSFYTTNNPYGMTFGFANLSDSGGDSGNTSLPYTTALLHGNYDYITGAFTWDAGTSDHNLPASFYQSSKPAWFGSLTFPAFGPSPSAPATALTGNIPAKYCYDQGQMPTCLVSGTPDTTAPSVPTGLTATAASASEIDLSWTASTDNVGVAGYGIYRGGVWISSVTTGTTDSDTGLTASTLYSYTITAYDAAANVSAQSSAVRATTQAPPGIPWSGILDPTRAIDWSSAGFAIPTYTTPCAMQPSLTANDPNFAAANTTAIQSALNSCDATHNVVNIPAGTYYVAGVTYGTQGKQVLRGIGPASTNIILTAEAGCAGLGHGVCMLAGDWTYTGDSSVLPPSGTRQCLWTAGYAQGATVITLSNCGGTPPVNKTLILDQANDSTDNGGIYMCDSSAANCTYEASGSQEGRHIGGAWHTQQQVTNITGVTALGAGSYAVTISPGVYFTNIRSGQNPGAWWPGFVQNDGIENMTLDGTSAPDGTLSMFSCSQCWAKNMRFINGARNDILMYQSMQSVIRDSYFYGAQSHYTESYTIESDNSSAFLIENNIFQQVTTPLTFNTGTGGVVGYNLAVKDIYTDGSWTWGMFAGHNAGNNFNLFEGNDTFGIEGDNAWGSSTQITMFRNFLTGYQPGTINTTVPFIFRAYNRVLNFVGNVLGQPNYHTQYEAYATSSSGFSGAANEYKTIYDLGGGGTGDACAANPGQSTLCDPLTRSTAMRWGNYDTVTNGTKWDSTEASPAAVTYVNANFTSSYFSSLAHALPASLYYNSKPYWWPAAKAWPPVGPDVTGGNLGTCSGPYAGSQATASGQCAGGSLSSGWSAHANSIPAQDCYLNVMQGPPDGSGNVLSFDGASCYGGTSPPPNNPPTVATPASASPNPVTGTTTALSVLGADDGGESNLTYTWPTLAHVTYSGATNGTNAAKNITAAFTQAGSYTFQVTITDAGNLSVTSSTTVIVNQTLSSIAVTPSGTTTVQTNRTQPFTAIAKDQFGNTLSPAPVFAWVVTGGGSINGAGLFTAGSAAGGPFNVTATAGGITSAAVHVMVSNNVPPSVTLTSPADGSTFTAPATINLTATATPGTNAVSSVKFSHDGILLNTDSASPYSFSWTNVAAGTYQISAVVTDSQGLTNTSNMATVVVNPVVVPPPPPPSSGPPAPPDPVLDLPNVLPVDSLIQLANASSYSGATFAWTFTPFTSSPVGSGGGSIHGSPTTTSGMTAMSAATQSATSAVPRYSLASLNLSLGTYVITVQANANGLSSNSVSEPVTLVETDLSGVKVYPNPWRSDKNGGKSVTFANLPVDCTVKIFTVSGRQAKDLGTVSGSTTWDLTNDSGDKVASGIYIYLIKDASGNKVRGKVAVLK